MAIEDVLEKKKRNDTKRIIIIIIETVKISFKLPAKLFIYHHNINNVPLAY